jgi:hypothetical protein
MKYLVTLLLLVSVAQAQYTNFVWSSATTSNVIYTNLLNNTNSIAAFRASDTSNMNFVVSNTVWSITNTMKYSSNIAYLAPGSNVMYLYITNGIVRTNTP